MNILALDLGTITGYALGMQRPIAGSKLWAEDDELKQARKNRMDRRCDLRVKRFFDWLTTGIPRTANLVVFEDVEFAHSRMQAQLWASYRTAVWLAFSAEIIECVPVGTLKKFAGHGGANKEAMLRFLNKQHPEIETEGMDDNAIDACWLWLWAKENLGRIKR